MSTLDVALRLRLINQLSAEAGRAAKDLAGIKTAAKGIEGTRGAEKLKRDLTDVSTASRQAGQNLATVRREAAGLGTVRGPEKLKRDLLDTAAAARQADRALAGIRARGVGGGGIPVGAGLRGVAGGIGLYATGRRAVQGYTDMADFERRMTRIGLTAEATAQQVAEAKSKIREAAKQYGLAVSDVMAGLEALVAQGRSLPEAMAFLPSVAATAQASGAAVDDMAKSADALASHLKISTKDMQAAFDILVAGGKAGQFELKDMARYLPSILPAVKALGIEGTQGLNQVVALLQIMRKGAGTSEEAATDLTNVLAKMESTETIKKFEKQGVDLEKVMAQARKEGKNLLDVFADATWKAIGGDLSKLNKLFEDMQVQRGMRSWLSMRQELQRMQAAIAKSAPGSAARDVAAVAGDAKSAVQKLSDAWTGFWMSAARVADSAGAPAALAELTKNLDNVGWAFDRASQALKRWRQSKEPAAGEQPAGPPTSVEELRARGLQEELRRALEQKEREVAIAERDLAAAEATAKLRPGLGRDPADARRKLERLRAEAAALRLQREEARLEERAAKLAPAPITITPDDQAKIDEERRKQAAEAEAQAKRRAAQPHSGKPMPATSLRDPMTGLPLRYPQTGNAPPGLPPVQGFDDAVPLRPAPAAPYSEYGPERPFRGRDGVVPAKPLDQVKRKAADAGAALDQLGDKAVAPTVDTASIDQALVKVRQLAGELARISGMTVSPKVAPRVAPASGEGARQLGRLGDSTGALHDTV